MILSRRDDVLSAAVGEVEGVSVFAGIPESSDVAHEIRRSLAGVAFPSFGLEVEFERSRMVGAFSPGRSEIVLVFVELIETHGLDIGTGLSALLRLSRSLRQVKSRLSYW